MRSSLVVGNWKMNGSRAMAAQLGARVRLRCEVRFDPDFGEN